MFHTLLQESLWTRLMTMVISCRSWLEAEGSVLSHLS